MERGIGISDIRCRLCGGLIVRQELYAHVRLGEGDARHVAPVCRGCLPFDVVELID